jgi:hypothetical protein
VLDDATTGSTTGRGASGLRTGGSDPLDDLSSEFLGDDTSTTDTAAVDEGVTTTTSNRSTRKKR